MPNIKSAKKRVLVNQTKAARNKALKSNLKTMMKTANQAVEAKADNMDAAVANAVKTIDMACSKGLIHKNNAARKKSKLVSKLNAAKA
ncbi:MAG TPA: 30S ribosomal protein S20 [Candidatus Egerieicola pullicola]|jgi:ribosomal protein S20|uniref:Small ribosomal subunit protein bS20 n=2 Tax=Candidatus Egerieicola TaxID=2840629 RepID=A0A9D1DDY0_9FIRM|nr:30S ribosomal protein S20 [Candidatus Egerieicola pullicola]HIU41300.1 30S ribosomal protein S20 [Candidatus Egerieicola faecale]